MRNHTSTPLIDAGSWSLGVFGTGLRGSVPAGRPVRFSYRDLLDLPTRTVMQRNGRLGLQPPEGVAEDDYAPVAGLTISQLSRAIMLELYAVKPYK